MNLHVLQVLTMCIFLGQICSGEVKITDEMRNKAKKDFRDSVYGAGEQFSDDYLNMHLKYFNHSYVRTLTERAMDLLIYAIPKEKNSKIDVHQVNDFHSNGSIFNSSRAELITLENLKVLESILSKQLPPKQYNGIVNLCYMIYNPNATSEEIESVLNYLYGTDSAASETSFVMKYSDPTAADCPNLTRLYSEIFDKLKSMIDIRSTVALDFTAIREKFPCNGYAYDFLNRFVKLIERFHGDVSKINSCTIEKFPRMWDEYPSSWEHFRESILPLEESVLLTRLAVKNVRGMINFVKAAIPGAPIDDIETALAYLYDDVPKKECPVTESSKLESE